MTRGAEDENEKRMKEGTGPPGRARRAAEDLDRHLPFEHPLRLFMAEHALMHRLADQLDDLCSALARGRGSRDATLKRIRGLALELRTASRAHQKREEEALFAALRDRGIHGPPDLLEHEHGDFQTLEDELVCQSEAMTANPDGDATPLFQAASSLIALSRSHIHRENEVLFPMVLELFTRDGIWDEVRRVSDTIPSSTEENES